MPLRVSVVINTLNRANLLPNTLAALVHQDHSDLEVVVVNGPSTDDTTAVLATWSDHIKIGTCPVANLSVSRNIGIAMATGDIVAFIDDDGVPEPEWIAQLVAAYDSPEVAAVGGRVLDHTGHRFQYHYANADRFGRGKWRVPRPCPEFCYPRAFEFPYLQGTNTSFRRDALLEIGGFDEQFVYYLDETDVCMRLIDHGFLIRQLHDAYVHHKYAPSYIRKAGAAIYRYPVLRSKVYFSNRHAKAYATQAEIDDDNLAFMEKHRADVLNNIALGRLDRSDLATFEGHVQQAFAEGRAAAEEPHRLITPALLAEHQSSFKRFPTHEPDEKLTLVFLCEDYPPALLGGIARFTKDKATALADKGHKVHVIARGHDHDTVDFENGVWVHRIVAKVHKRPPAVRAINLPASHWNQSMSYLEEIDRISSHRTVDIVEAPVWNVPGLACMLSQRYRVLTSLQTTLKISEPYRPDLHRDPSTLRNFVEPIIAAERMLIAESDAVIAISKAIADEVEAAYDLKIGKHRLYVAPLGMPDWADRDVPPENICLDAGPTKILFVGRLETRKGIDLLLEAAPILTERHPDVTIDIVGDDSIRLGDGSTYRERFEAAYPALAGTRVMFHGKLPDDALRAHYKTCDIFVAPSRFESFGLIYLEAMMFAKPVIACDAGGVAEVVDANVTGILAEPGSAPELLGALERLIGDPALRIKLGRNGRSRYERRFSDVEMAECALRGYIELLEIDRAAQKLLGRDILEQAG